MTTILSADRAQRAYVSIAAIDGGAFVREPGEALSRYAWRIDQIVSQSPREPGELRRLRQAVAAGLEPEPILLFKDEDGGLSMVGGLLRTAAAALAGRTSILAIVYAPANSAEADFVSEAAFHLACTGMPMWAFLRHVADYHGRPAAA